MDEISVIVPIYRVERELDRCVSSLVNQTYPDLEIILVDDGSPDHCPAICDKWAERDRRIKVIHKENGGVSSARNEGLAVARGAYIAFVDGDDSLPEDALRILHDRLIKDGSDLAIGKHIDVYEDGSVNGAYCDWMRGEVLSKGALLQVMGQARHYPVSACGKLYRKQVFEGLTYPPMTYGEDLWLFPSIAERCETISSVGKTVYFYHQRNSSASHNKSDWTRSEELSAVLHMASYLQSQGFGNGAKTWLRTAVDKVAEMQCKQDGIEIIKNWINIAERRAVLDGCPLKTKLKWLLLHIPVLFNAVRGLKRMGRGKKIDGSD